MSGFESIAVSGALEHRERIPPAMAAKGAQYVLMSGGKMYKLTNHAADLKAHAGVMVTVTGDVKGDTVSVSKVEVSKK